MQLCSCKEARLRVGVTVRVKVGVRFRVRVRVRVGVRVRLRVRVRARVRARVRGEFGFELSLRLGLRRSAPIEGLIIESRFRIGVTQLCSCRGARVMSKSEPPFDCNALVCLSVRSKNRIDHYFVGDGTNE